MIAYILKIENKIAVPLWTLYPRVWSAVQVPAYLRANHGTVVLCGVGKVEVLKGETYVVIISDVLSMSGHTRFVIFPNCWVEQGDDLNSLIITAYEERLAEKFRDMGEYAISIVLELPKQLESIEEIAALLTG